MGKNNTAPKKSAQKPSGSQTQIKPSTSVERNQPKRQRKLTSFQQALKEFEKGQEEKRQQREQDRIERAKKAEAMQEYNKNKKRIGKVIKKTNKKGQPNLGAQVEVLLEKMQTKIAKNKF